VVVEILSRERNGRWKELVVVVVIVVVIVVVVIVVVVCIAGQG
jgi:hypothetical protein